MLNKKGAMFGLDARIALAIFGALSVISGAALYSAIQNAKVVSLLTEMNELGKAVESYMVDTGSNLPVRDAVFTQEGDYSKLISSTEKGWNGPYFSYPPLEGSTYRFDHPVYEYGHIYYLNDVSVWGEAVHPWVDTNLRCGGAISKDGCKIYVFYSLVDKAVVLALDNQIDSADGGERGRVRYSYTDISDSKYQLFYQFANKM